MKLGDVVLASGHDLPRGKDGRPVYTVGQIHLGGTLMNLDAHPLELSPVYPLLAQHDLVPDDALSAVAAEIAEQHLHHRPRLKELEGMCRAGMAAKLMVEHLAIASPPRRAL